MKQKKYNTYEQTIVLIRLDKSSGSVPVTRLRVYVDAILMNVTL